MSILKIILSLFIIFQTWLPLLALAATEFTITVKSSGGDATTLSAAESIVDENLIAADIKVFSISAASTPTLVDGEIVAGVTSLATGVCVHVNAARTQVLIKTIVGTFQSGEVVKKSTDAAVTVTLSNAGDSPISGMALYASASPDTTFALIDGATTGASNYIDIYCPTGEGHSGKYDATKYLLNVPTNLIALQIKDDYVRVHDCQWENNTLTASANVIAISVIAAANDIRIYNNIIKRASSTSYINAGIFVNDADAIVRIWNNVIFNGGNFADSTNAAIDVNNSATAYIYNNTLSDGKYGINANIGTVTAINNIVTGFGNTLAYFGTFAAATNYNSTDGTDTTGQGANSRTSQIFTFIGSITGDFHLASTDTGALNFGTDLSGDANLAFTNDIDSIITRYGTWDIGADELGFITNGGATGGTGLLHGTVVH